MVLTDAACVLSFSASAALDSLPTTSLQCLRALASSFPRLRNAYAELDELWCDSGSSFSLRHSDCVFIACDGGSVCFVNLIDHYVLPKLCELSARTPKDDCLKYRPSSMKISSKWFYFSSGDFAMEEDSFLEQHQSVLYHNVGK